MNSKSRVLVSALFAAHILASAAPEAPDPDRTIEPLRLLLESASLAIPRKSTCFGNYGQRGSPRIRDLLGSRLAYLHSGQNVISGSCNLKHCELEIRHSAGEDVASATISFEVGNGIPSIRNLSCVITP